MKRLLVLGAIVGSMAAALALLLLRVPLLPSPASAEAQPIDRLFGLLAVIAAIIFAIVTGFLLYALVAFRRRTAGDEGQPLHGHAGLEAVWTLVPLAIVIGLGIQGGRVLRDITRPAAGGDLLEVRVQGLQYAWLFEYPDLGIRSTELRLPAGRPVLLRLTARDVIHSFWVPEFRVKQDAVPGMETRLKVTPTRVGEYELACAEVCGVGHSFMRAKVVVLEPEVFQEWAAGQAAQATVVPGTPQVEQPVVTAPGGGLHAHTVAGTR